MRRAQVIDAVEFKRIPTWTPSWDRFAYRRDRPFRWLQKICFWFLRKLQCHAMDETTLVERHVIDADDFIGRLVKQYDGVRNLLNQHPSRIYMGAEDFEELMNEGEDATIGFNFRTQYYQGSKIFGLPVDVLTTMRGVLVVP